MNTNWFQTTFGFQETNAETVYRELEHRADKIVSRKDGREWQCGTLQIATLSDLKQELDQCRQATFQRLDKPLRLNELVGEAGRLHKEPANHGSMFQVASQFNLLEMVSPTVTPEEGITRYEHDRTQGPACAVACGAGTLYRNYFVPVQDRIGQTADKQIDCLDDIGASIGNEHSQLWVMRNGYVQATRNGLEEVDSKLANMSEAQLNDLRGLLRIGIQWHTEVTSIRYTAQDSLQLVSQAYCSALPIAYNSHPEKLWQRFAQLILDGTYEATFAAAAINFMKFGHSKLFLTYIGGGVFGNRLEWILNAIRRAATLYSDYPLDVSLVSYGQSNPTVQHWLKESGFA